MKIRKKSIPTTVDEAMSIARKRYPEDYKDIEIKGFAMSQRIDVNAFKRMKYARRLIKKHVGSDAS